MDPGMKALWAAREGAAVGMIWTAPGYHSSQILVVWFSAAAIRSALYLGSSAILARANRCCKSQVDEPVSAGQTARMYSILLFNP